MMTNSINVYGDKLIKAGAGHGADIASQRQDELDRLSIERVGELILQGYPVRTLDLGCGRGAQSKRLLEAGADLSVAVDKANFKPEFLSSAKQYAEKASFYELDLNCKDFNQKLVKCSENDKFDIIIFQRTLHYLTYAHATVLMKQIQGLLTKNGRLYISASGLFSELGNDYAGKTLPIAERFSPLSETMAVKHGIQPSVCLYRTEELANLCQESGLSILMAQESEFGNIKIIAELL
jgi:SAM-dependent methyltransferase